MGFFEGLASLHGDGSVDVGVGEFVYEVQGQEVAANGGHAVVDPSIFGGGVAPEMMVGVGDLGFCGGVSAHAGTMLLGPGRRCNFVAVSFGDGRLGDGRICFL